MSDNIYWGGADHLYCGYCGKGPGHADDCTRPQPTASVDADSCAEEAFSSGNLVTNDGYYEFDLEAATAVIQAYGDARADAARREAVDAARSAVFAILRKHDVDEQMFAEIAAATHALKKG